ncbi:MAG: hypothetical protein I3273_04955 [Candidatus Moeniiplasma glomeromycotorum]|nr:hypothetical protein [Candidatus Moeniiplasma glomeromycotorum]MCE8167891.1 hypothetical protein [Candidatus Moeniiplasma glomeromycotorum]MCE8169441.1 hypothetical protein [Candidatus Moeniiplasma glomeromycotorum]
MSEENKCRRCPKFIEETKKCGGKDCPVFNARDIWKSAIKEKWGIDLVDKYFIENLCNNCEELLEKTLTTFNNFKLGTEATKEFEKESGGKFTYEIDGGQKGRCSYDIKLQTIKIWEDDKVYEFDLKKESLENILNSMNF